MAFEGTLEDLAIVDVLQLLHVSRKTGVLLVFGHDSDAHIVLKDGRIVGCKHPSKTKNIGQVLVEMGAVTEADIDDAVRAQQEAGDSRRPFMATLVELGTLEEKTGWKALESLIESTVVELVSWQEGHFVFELGEIASFDEFAHVPREVDTQLSVDTQSALMEAVRIIDERNRDKAQPAGKAAIDVDPASADDRDSDDAENADEADPPQPNEPTDAAPPPTDRLVAHLGTATADERPNDRDALDDIIDERLGGDWQERAACRVVLFSDDGLLKMSMRSLCIEHTIDIFVTEIGKDVFEKLLAWRNDESPPILVCDVDAKTSGDSWHRQCVRLLARCRKEHAEVPFILLSEPRIECFSEGFAHGAAAVLPRPDPSLSRSSYVDEMRKLYSAIVSCVKATFQRRSVLAYRLGEAHRRMAVLKARIREVRFPDGPSQISLVVLRHVADYVERCVLFLVRKNDLLALGAFGLDDNAETVSSAITRLRMPIDNGSLLARTVQSGCFYCGENSDALLRTHLYKCIGEPANPEMVLVPLRTKDKTAAIIYGDFGSQPTNLVETDSLEILADHAGMAFELALAERR